MENQKNIILIGMPGSGKSTAGVLLAKKTGRQFLDTDILIQADSGRLLQEIVDTQGYMELRRIEEECLLRINCVNHVISTGGSAVYSDAVMMHLKQGGIAVFLHVNIKTLLARIDDFQTRGIAKRKDQSFEDLFMERHLLYMKNADMTIDSSEMSPEETSDEIIRRINQCSAADV